MLPVGVLAALLGICAKSMYPDAQAALALPQVIVGLQPVLAGVTLAALWRPMFQLPVTCCFQRVLCFPTIFINVLSTLNVQMPSS